MDVRFCDFLWLHAAQHPARTFTSSETFSRRLAPLDRNGEEATTMILPYLGVTLLRRVSGGLALPLPGRIRAAWRARRGSGPHFSQPAGGCGVRAHACRVET